jgi:hypothetical protein
VRLASALSVSSRLWLGGAVKIRRERGLIRTLLEGVRACGAFDTLLLCTVGLSRYAKQALSVLREPLRTGKRGRPRLLLPEGLMIALVIKRYARRRVIGVVRRVVRGTEEAVYSRLASTQESENAVINTAYIERLQATFPSRLALLRAYAYERRNPFFYYVFPCTRVPVGNKEYCCHQCYHQRDSPQHSPFRPLPRVRFVRLLFGVYGSRLAAPPSAPR